jgi:death-on-curing protein
MITFSKNQLLALHRELMAETGDLDGLRDDGMLDSALNAPFQSFDGEDVYPSLQQKAARLCFGLVKNHPFIDGNKRIGAHAMLVFLALNGIELEYTQDELSSVILSLAAGEVGQPELLRWVVEHET